MKAIITGDIINSEKYKASTWLDILKKYFNQIGQPPRDWEIYRGDEFQLKVPVEKALEVALHIKALIKSIKGLDVRMGIGVGEITFVGNGVSESNGPAYILSGRSFESLKANKLNLSFASNSLLNDRALNLMLKLALDFIDDWSPVSAEIVALVLENPNAPQKVIAEQLNIKQSAVSQRQKRARLDLVLELLAYYEESTKKIAP
ncbi:winged helix-turn-helix transcriptional regulator [Kriegella sp. EG-1]|nr:winged helix-turn-helix transcriptional regulator [Flavobacteriaceae bacterium EG-1]